MEFTLKIRAHFPEHVEQHELLSVIKSINAECGVEDDWNVELVYNMDATGFYYTAKFTGLKTMPDERQRSVLWV